jgi:hypothetical protein
MYSSQGLADWELICVSGGLAAVMLAASAFIGAIVAYIALYEPKPAVESASKPGWQPGERTEPIGKASAGAAFALRAGAAAG